MKTILIFTWFYVPYLGGAELFVKAITERLSRRFRFVIVTARGSMRPPSSEERDGVHIIRAGFGAPLDKFLYPPASLLHSLRLPNVDLVHAIMVNASALAAYAHTRIRPRPTLLTLQEGDSEDYVKRYLGPFFPLYRRLHRPFDRIHAISRHLEEQAVSYGADRDTVRVIPNGVDERIFHPASEASPEGSQKLRERLALGTGPVVVSVSRLVHKNGVDRLVEALPLLRSRAPDAALVLVGDGSERDALTGLARTLGVESHVRFVGEVPHEETAPYLRMADVFCRPSRSEGLGSAFLEAMAAGTPVVATSVGGIPDIIRHGENGLLVDPPTPERIADALEQLIVDRGLAQQVRRAGIELVRARYRWDGIANEIGALYDELLA